LQVRKRFRRTWADVSIGTREIPVVDDKTLGGPD
jgi:hypothetical protein